MSTDVTDSALSIFLEPEARGLLTTVLQPGLVTMSSLTLVLLAGDDASTCDNASLHELRTTLDELEQMALVGMRRTDRVVRCSASCVALVLLDTGVEGAQCVVKRLAECLKPPTVRRSILLMGLATTSEHATEPEALIAQAGICPLSLVLPGEQRNANWSVAARKEWPGTPFTPQRLGGARRSGGVIRRFDPALAASAEAVPAEPERHAALRRAAQGSGVSGPVATFVQTRALALGVPYLAPPESIPASVRNLLPPEVMVQLQCLPVGRERNVLTVALADPTDRGVLSQLEQITGMTIFPVMTDPDVLAKLARPVRPRRAPHLSPAPVSRSSR